MQEEDEMLDNLDDNGLHKGDVPSNFRNSNNPNQADNSNSQNWTINQRNTSKLII